MRSCSTLGSVLILINAPREASPHDGSVRARGKRSSSEASSRICTTSVKPTGYSLRYSTTLQPRLSPARTDPDLRSVTLRYSKAITVSASNRGGVLGPWKAEVRDGRQLTAAALRCCVSHERGEGDDDSGLMATEGRNRAPGRSGTKVSRIAPSSPSCGEIRVSGSAKSELNVVDLPLQRIPLSCAR